MSASKTVQFSFKGRVIWDSAKGQVFLAGAAFDTAMETDVCWSLDVYTIPLALALLVLFHVRHLIHMLYHGPC